jgi:hypothetical protein
LKGHTKRGTTNKENERTRKDVKEKEGMKFLKRNEIKKGWKNINICLSRKV